jgi:2,3-bisphosphoglycerate-dependent phosphoglycerate mutase
MRIGDQNRIIIVRHGQTTANAMNRMTSADQIMTGQFDVPLDEDGRRQAATVGERLFADESLRISAIYSSDLERALETARIISQCGYRDIPVRISSALRERSLGAFEGKRESELRMQYGPYFEDANFSRWRADFVQRAPGGENFDDVTRRVKPLIDEIAADFSGDSLIVSHFRTICCIVGYLLDLPREQTVNLKIPNAEPVFVPKKGPRCGTDGLTISRRR